MKFKKSKPIQWSNALQSYAEGNNNVQLDGKPFELAMKNAEVGFSAIVELIFHDCKGMEVAKLFHNEKSTKYVGIS